MILKKCPECCACAMLHPVTHRVGQTFYLVVCQSCGAGPNKAFATENLAISHWNKGKFSHKRPQKINDPAANLIPEPVCS